MYLFKNPLSVFVLRYVAEFTASQRGESSGRRQSMGVGNAASATKMKRKSFAMAGIVDKNFGAGESDEEAQHMRTPPVRAKRPASAEKHHATPQRSEEGSSGNAILRTVSKHVANGFH